MRRYDLPDLAALLVVVAFLWIALMRSCSDAVPRPSFGEDPPYLGTRSGL